MKKIILFLVALSLFSAGFSADLKAQTRSSKQKNSAKEKGEKRKKVSRKFVAKNSPKKPLKNDLTKTATPPVPLPVTQTVQNDAVTDNVSTPKATEEEISGDVQSGNVVVNVSSNGNAVVKLGLAERGVSVIDFPVGDPVYRIHPGDENFVTVDCSPRGENGKCGNAPTDAIVLRPGKNFHSLGSEESAATVITVQRVSGIVVSFIIVPVKQIAQNANYVVVRYDLKEAIEARRQAGLAVNLQPGMIVLPNNGNSTVETNAAVTNTEFLNVKDDSEKDKSGETKKTSLEEAVVGELQKAALSGDLFKFSEPVYGLSLARVSDGSRTGDMTIDVVAIRNTLPQAVRLVPDQPELLIENREKSEESVNLQRVNILHTATTVEADDVLEPGKVYYFAIAYASPILGVRQVLRISFARREAADAPASLDLSGETRKKKGWKFWE